MRTPPDLDRIGGGVRALDLACRTLVDAWRAGDLEAEGDRRRLALLRRDDVVRPTVYVGTGTCGLGAGADRTLARARRWAAERSVDAEVVEVGCLGLCAAEPLLDVQLPRRARLSFAEVDEEAVPELLGAVLEGEVPPAHLLGQHAPGDGARAWEGVPLLDAHPFFAAQTRWVLAHCGRVDPTRIEPYLASGGYRTLARVLRGRRPVEVCEEVERSGLRGRGGGGFLTGRKWRMALEARSPTRYLVCNADEGDPGAFMDRALIEGDPHRLVEGMILAAYAIGARTAYVYVRAEYPLAVRRLSDALSQARDYGLLGQSVLGTDFGLDIRIKLGAGAFVCGEETALMHSIEGKRGTPRPRPPFPAESGLFGGPTVINNVETLANLPTLLERGAGWFSAVGTEGSKGTKVFALSGKVARTGLVEVAMGTPLRRIVEDVGGGVPGGKALKAVQIGGPSGGCIPPTHLDVPVDYQSLLGVGAMMGSGGLVVMDETTCMVDVARFFMDFIQRESCGKCTPCREGTRRLLERLERICRGGRGEEEVHRFEGVTALSELAEVVRDTSLCGLGRSAPNPVLSTLRWFPDEYEAHVYGGRCAAKVCRDLLTWTIDPDRCTGCRVCARKCPTRAISGEKREPHTIDADTCIACGACAEVCRFDAIAVA